MTLTKFIVGALLIAGATSASAVTLVSFIPEGGDPNTQLVGTALTASTPVLFNFNIPELAPAGQFEAMFTLSATETGAAAFGPITLANFDGSFSLIYTGAPTMVGGVGLFTGANLLSGTFLGSIFTGYGSTGSLLDSILAGGLVSLNSDYFIVDPSQDQGVALHMTDIFPGASINIVNGLLSDFTSATGGDYSGTYSGVNYHTDVPEPASWAMMVAGFGLLGGAIRRARRSTLAVVTA